jgi:hypothetical protein
MTKLLNIKEQASNEAISPLEIPWKKRVILYEDNEMVNYSLARWLEMKISNELVSIDQVTRIEVKEEEKINRHNYDLTFLVRFSLE